MLAIQTDVYSAYDHFLAAQVLAAFERKHGKDAFLKRGLDVLRRWNGQMDKDAAAPVITQLMSANIQEQLLRIARLGGASRQPDAPGNQAARTNEPIADPEPNTEVVMRLLATRPAGWVNDWDALLVEAFTSALKRAETVWAHRFRDGSTADYSFGISGTP